jgi:nucleoside-diphosphate kinase
MAAFFTVEDSCPDSSGLEGSSIERIEVVKERTLSIIKPDGVQRGLVGEIIGRLEKAGFRIVAMKMVRLTKEQAERFYAVHRDRPFFQGLTEFMASGPSVVMALEGENVISRYRDMMGATEPAQAAEGTIRRAFATDSVIRRPGKIDRKRPCA